MNTNATETWEQLRAEYAALEASGVANHEAWFLAGFDVGEARRWAGYEWTPDEALTWIDLIEQDHALAAAWVAVGMPEPVDPFLIMEAAAACRHPRVWQEWRMAGFSHASLVSWRDAGFADPAVAGRWAEAGFTATMARDVLAARAR